METDLLGAPYESMPLVFEPDDEGEVVATLVRRRADEQTGRAVLYLHGFIDYFFQTHLADFFVERGYDFYALDLRKHGRSLRPHQTPNFCRDISDYFPEIDEAVRIIRERDGHDTVLLNGHSTGGLVAALWADRRRGRGRVQALFLNSPFFDFREAWVVRRGLSRMVQRVGRRRPYATMPQRIGTVYGRSLHRDHYGEWHYDLAWKPLDGYPIRAGWVRAIAQAHRQVQAGLAIDVPVLVACSARTYRGRRFAEDAHHADAVLDVADIVRWSPGLGRHVTIVRVEGGKHDLTLSPQQARAYLFAELDRWLGVYLENRALAPVRPSQAGRTGAESGLAPHDAG